MTRDQEAGIMLVTTVLVVAIVLLRSLQIFRTHPQLVFAGPTLEILLGLDLTMVALLALMGGSMTAGAVVLVIAPVILTDGIKNFFDARRTWYRDVRYRREMMAADMLRTAIEETPE